MPLDSTAIAVLLWLVVLLHIAVPVVVLCDRTSWSRKFLSILAMCLVPVVGPLYYLLFRSNWTETATKHSKGGARDPITRNT